MPGPGGCAWSRGGCAWSRGVSALGSVYLVRGCLLGGYLVLGGVCSGGCVPGLGGVSALGVYLVLGGTCSGTSPLWTDRCM